MKHTRDHNGMPYHRLESLDTCGGGRTGVSPLNNTPVIRLPHELGLERRVTLLLPPWVSSYPSPECHFGGGHFDSSSDNVRPKIVSIATSYRREKRKPSKHCKGRSKIDFAHVTTYIIISSCSGFELVATSFPLATKIDPQNTSETGPID